MMMENSSYFSIHRDKHQTRPAIRLQKIIMKTGKKTRLYKRTIYNNNKNAREDNFHLAKPFVRLIPNVIEQQREGLLRVLKNFSCCSDFMSDKTYCRLSSINIYKTVQKCALFSSCPRMHWMMGLLCDDFLMCSILYFLELTTYKKEQNKNEENRFYRKSHNKRRSQAPLSPLFGRFLSFLP